MDVCKENLLFKFGTEIKSYEKDFVRLSRALARVSFDLPDFSRKIKRDSARRIWQA